MASFEQVSRNLSAAFSNGGLPVMVEQAHTEVVDSIPIDTNALRSKKITRKNATTMFLEHGEGLPYQSIQYFGKLRHLVVGGKLASIVSAIGGGQGASGHPNIYSRAYNKAVKRKLLEPAFAPKWYEVLQDPLVQDRLAVEFTRGTEAAL